MGKIQKNIKEFCQDKDGKIVLAQTPNIPIYIWGAATILGKVVNEGRLSTLAETVGFAFICIWAWLEITQGSSNFRRVLGIIVLTASLYSRVF
jgi:hypothetical protein